MKILKKVTLVSIIILYMLSIKTFADTGKINIEATRIRKENNTTSDILTVIYKNDEVEILETKGEWFKIKYKEYTGFVKKEFVDIENEEKSSSSKQDVDVNAKKENTNETKNEAQVSVYDNESQTDMSSNEVSLNTSTSLRTLPNFMSKKVQEIEQGTKLTVLSKMNHWLKVTDGTVVGWITEIKTISQENVPTVDSSDLETDNTVANEIQTNTISNKVDNTVANTTTQSSDKNATSVSKKGKVNVETAKVRKEPSTSAGLIDFLDYGDEVSISKETGDWYYINHQNIEGYVNKKLITIIDEEVSSRSLIQERSESDNATTESILNSEEKDKNIIVTSNQVVEYAKQYLNYSYVSGGKTPATGFDCSGFTQYIYKNFGFSLANTAAGQTSVGVEISREELQPGDLILFYDEGKTKIGHTGIYLGNGEFIHAANPERGVVIDNLNTNSYYNQRYVTARRIV